MADLGLGVDPATEVATLSRGQATRAGLASLLLSRYDVFLLDEPTNDLDLDGLERLEQFVSGLRVGVGLISHDREFLVRTATKIVELDLAQQQVKLYGGGYTAYLAERQIARRQAREAYEGYADRVGELTERARTQRAWMEKGVKNARRKATDNDKIGRKFRSEATEKQASKARQTDRLIERLEVVEEPRKEWALQMEIAAAPRAGAIVATASGAVARRGAFTLGPVDLQIDWADRVAITGPNGAGKSTLLAMLLGRLAPERGAAGVGPGVRIGEIDQARSAFADGTTLLRAFGEQVPDQAEADVRTLLAKYGLRSDHVLRPAASLSPGERTRARPGVAAGPAGSTCSFSTNRRITPRPARRSNSSRKRWRPTPERFCWSRTTRRAAGGSACQPAASPWKRERCGNSRPRPPPPSASAPRSVGVGITSGFPRTA